MAVKLFVEGIADDKFLRDYISEKYNINLEKEDIIKSEGWSNIKSEFDGENIKNAMLKNSDNAGKNLLIFDADNDYTKRLSEINEWKNENKLDFEIFLWPNNYAPGDLETVLENIINPINKPIFDCWNNYENCLKSKKIEGRKSPLTTPANKTKIYGYLEALLGESKSQKKKIKELNRNYQNIKHWDLNSDYLNSLNKFLNRYFL